jgi:CRP/FNR family transcriptional regulator, cyclic AMP receptor protein
MDRAIPARRPPTPDSDWAALPDVAEPPPAAANWALRAAALGATLPADPAAWRERWLALWGADPLLAELDAGARARLAAAFEPVHLAAGAIFIEQDEVGDFLAVVLDGRAIAERVHPTGARLRLAELRAGDVAGEMSLLDAGARFATCTARGGCTLGVLEASRLQALVREEPRLAVALLASLSRRLSLRVRQLSVRLAALSTSP